jgi:hypothetical protein
MIRKLLIVCACAAALSTSCEPLGGAIEEPLESGLSAGGVSVSGVSLNKTSASLVVGATETLTATVSPANATNKAVSWSSASPAVATVGANGLVSAVAVGTAAVTVTTADGAYTDTCSVMVMAAGAQWARSVSAGNASVFYSVAVGGAGDVYAAGYQSGTGTCDYGNGVTATGTSSSNNGVLVKYDSSGTAQWARSVSAGTNNSVFYSVAVGGAGDVYAAGYQSGTGTYNYGNSVTTAGTYSGENVVLVKYSE